MASHDPSGRRWLAFGGLLVGLGSALLLRPRARLLPTTGRNEQRGFGTSAQNQTGTEPGEEEHVFDYDGTDADAGVLAKVMLVAVLVIGLSIGGLFLLIGRFHSADRQPALTPQQSAFIAPPGPPLQDDPLRDIAALTLRENALLTSYAWLDPDRHRARIPIARGVALVVGRSLDPKP